ncbi:ethanolamine utilization cobalamin adenosyltransferase [Escherichia coli]|nr:ethanolamine utilization cobalamin adenosyltransferase [Escherichia coli]
MKDFITEAWLRANHTLSEGAEIHLPADSRLTPLPGVTGKPPSAHQVY